MKFFLYLVAAAILSFSCKPPSESEEKKLKDNFYGKPSESGNWAIPESDKVYHSLPDKTLILSFDDGPRPHTAKLLDFLKKEKIKASFFVIANTLIRENGYKDSEYISIIKRAHAEGHIVANHTYTHKSSTPAWGAIKDKAAAFRSELVLAHKTLEKIIGKQSHYYFRPPGGWWLKEETKYILGDPLFSNYFGPVPWNIGGGPLTATSASDHECWLGRVTVQECARKYIAEIERKRKGIVLFHDLDQRTVEMFIKYIYPAIKSKGYKVVSLDETPYYKKQLEESKIQTNNSDTEVTDKCENPGKFNFSTLGSKLKLFHGETGVDYSADLTVIKKEESFTPDHLFYLDVKHTDGDSSVFGITPNDDQTVLGGIRFNISWNKAYKVPFKVVWGCDKWEGTFNHSDGYQEKMSISIP